MAILARIFPLTIYELPSSPTDMIMYSRQYSTLITWLKKLAIKLSLDWRLFMQKILTFYLFRLLWYHCINFFVKTTLIETTIEGSLLPKLFWPMGEKNVLLINKNFWNSRLKAENLQNTIYSNSERSEQFLVTECFFNLFLEVSHI